MDSEKDYGGIEEIIADLGWDGLVKMARRGELGEWLENHGYEYENNVLRQYLHKEKISDIDVLIQLYDILDIKDDMLTLDKVREISKMLQEQRERGAYIGATGNQEYEVATTQQELSQALVKAPQCVYLCNNDFRIPLSKGNITYIGRGNAVVTVANRENLNFADLGISLQHMMLFRVHDIVVDEANLSDVTLLPAEENGRENLFLFYNLSLGRSAFESKDEFRRRLNDLLEVKIGTIFLNDSDYDMREKKFYIHLHSDISFLDYVTAFTFKKKLWFVADRAMAADVYERQRKVAVYAVFDTDGDRIYISKLQIHFLKYGTTAILYEDEIPSEAVSSGGRGYGLYLIDKF